jgi:hypothetical protein
MGFAALLVVVLLAGLAACTSGSSGDGDQAADAPELTFPDTGFEDVPEVTLPEGFVQPDTRGVRLAPVVARPRGGTPPLPVTGGRASIRGRVTGPDGPVTGATVRIERWVGSRSGSMLVGTNDAGDFSASGLLGGRFRVRAWLQPNQTATRSVVLFLADDQAGTADVELERFEGLRLQGSLDVSAFNVGDTARVRALLTRAAVDADGIVVGEAVPGAQVQLTAPDGLRVTGPNPTATGENGIASIAVECDREGAYTVSLSTEGASTSVTLPACGPRPTTTTTTPGAPEVPPFAVGEEFTVPRSAPLPPGTYETFLDGCETSFEAWVNGSWERREIEGRVMALSVPARSFRPAAGTDGCRYRRTA